MRSRSIIPSLAAYALVACSNSETTPVAPEIIHLTQAQAAAVLGQVTQLAQIHPALRWLADSASLVLKSGAEVDPVDITTDLGAGPFYAIGLQNANIVTTSTSTSTLNTFYFIAFNNPSSPTDFIVIDGFKSVSGSAVPTEASAAFGGSTVVGHMFHVESSTIAAYRASIGSATLTSLSPGGTCQGLTLPTNTTCAETALKASFNIVQALRDNGGVVSATRSALLSQATVAGIRLITTR